MGCSESLQITSDSNGISSRVSSIWVRPKLNNGLQFIYNGEKKHQDNENHTSATYKLKNNLEQKQKRYAFNRRVQNQYYIVNE